MMFSTRDSVIGLLSWDYGHPKGGMGRSLRQIISALMRHGLEIKVLAPCPLDDRGTPFLAPTRRFGGQILFSLLLPFTLRRRLYQMKIGGLLMPVGPGGVFLLRRPPVPAVAIVYHSYAQQAALVPGQSWKRIFQPFECLTLRFCRRIICFSDDTKQALVDCYDIDPDIIALLPHAVAVSEHPSVERDPELCICVARLEQRKGVRVLLHAWKKISAHRRHARLVIIGDGVQRSQIDRMIAHLPRVARRSSVSQQELSDLLARAAIAFCPAYLEGFGLACAEAMAAGCCVIASDADSLRRLIIQGESGILVPAGQSDALASVAIGALNNPDRMKEIGSAAIDRIRSIADPQTADALLAGAVRTMFA